MTEYLVIYKQGATFSARTAPNGEEHLDGHLVTEEDFSGPTPVTYALQPHPEGAHGAHEDHLSGTATTKDGSEAPSGAWAVSLLKNTQTKKVTGAPQSPDGPKTFTFNVDHHQGAASCAGA